MQIAWSLLWKDIKQKTEYVSCTFKIVLLFLIRGGVFRICKDLVTFI